jgi:hypothetical protein
MIVRARPRLYVQWQQRTRAQLESVRQNESPPLVLEERTREEMILLGKPSMEPVSRVSLVNPMAADSNKDCCSWHDNSGNFCLTFG